MWYFHHCVTKESKIIYVTCESVAAESERGRENEDFTSFFDDLQSLECFLLFLPELCLLCRARGSWLRLCMNLSH